MCDARGLSRSLIACQTSFDGGGVGGRVAGRRAEDVRVAAVHLLGDAAGDVVEGEGAGLLGDHGVEVDLQQQVAELLAQVVPVTGLVAGVDRLEGLVGLLEQVASQRAVGLLALPRALGAQPPHHRQELQQRLARRPARLASRLSRDRPGGRAASSV